MGKNYEGRVEPVVGTGPVGWHQAAGVGPGSRRGTRQPADLTGWEHIVHDLGTVVSVSIAVRASMFSTVAPLLRLPVEKSLHPCEGI